MNATNQGIGAPEAPEEFARRLGLPIRNTLLLSRALTHSSYLNEHPEAIEDNERLEFLGDAVLDFLVGAWLYRHYPEMREGDLTRLRSALVRTEMLADFGRQINLGAAMRLGRGEVAGGGRDRTPLLCGTFEALVGALYLDCGMYSVIQFIEPMLEPAAWEIQADELDHDPKSRLQEEVQAQGYGSPIYRTVNATGPEHKKTFEVEVIVNGEALASGRGHSKQAATKAAARAALMKMGIK